jgi:hypothetical protein
MFINSQVGLLSPEKLANSAMLAVGLSQALGSAGGINSGNRRGLCGLIGAAVSALSKNICQAGPRSGFSKASPLCRRCVAPRRLLGSFVFLRLVAWTGG